MDHISTELTKASIEKALETAESFLSRLLGPALEEAGLLLKEKVRLCRLKNQLRILGKAQDMLREAGLEPNAVPLRTLLPLLEGSSLEDDESLSSKWAALIANAAGGTMLEGSHPAFPKILGEMSPQEALMLDRLTDQGGEARWESFRQDFAKELLLSVDDVNQKYTNLFRLGLCRIHRKQDKGDPVISISPFGQYFVRACTRPSQSDT